MRLSLLFTVMAQLSGCFRTEAAWREERLVGCLRAGCPVDGQRHATRSASVLDAISPDRDAVGPTVDTEAYRAIRGVIEV